MASAGDARRGAGGLPTACAAFAEPPRKAPGEHVFASVRESVRKEPTSEANLPARLRMLGNVAMLVPPKAGSEAMEFAPEALQILQEKGSTASFDGWTA